MSRLQMAWLPKTKIFLKNHLPQILAGAATGGVVATGILSALGMKKATEKMEEVYQYHWDENMDEDEEKVFNRKRAKVYISSFTPAFLAGAGTIACVIGATVKSAQVRTSLTGTLAVLTSKYAGVKEEYREYQQATIDICGEDVHQQILDRLEVTKCEPPYLLAEDYAGRTSLSIDGEEEKRLFFDNLTSRYFESTLSKVLEAEYHLNRNFTLRGYVSWNEYCQMFGLVDEVKPNGEHIGWQVEDGVYWLDFNHETEDVETPEVGQPLECVVIDIRFSPEDLTEY